MVAATIAFRTTKQKAFQIGLRISVEIARRFAIAIPATTSPRTALHVTLDIAVQTTSRTVPGTVLRVVSEPTSQTTLFASNANYFNHLCRK